MNCVQIMGRLTDIPHFEEKDTLKIARYILAINNGKEKDTDFIPCTAYGNNAVVAQQYLNKGQLVAKIDDYVLNRDKYEVEAESAAYMVCKHFGLDTSDYSFGYISSWAFGKEIKDYEDSLKLSSDVSKQIINELNGYFEHLLVKQKQHIKAELNKNHFKDNEKLIDNIHKLYITTNSSSLKDIKELCTKDIPEETRNLLSSVTDELRKQEFKLMSQQPSR